MLRYYLRWVNGTTVKFDPAQATDQSGTQILIAGVSQVMESTDFLRVDAFVIDGLYDNSADRLSDANKTTDDIGKIYQQQNDLSFWTITAMTGSTPTWDPYTYTPPAL